MYLEILFKMRVLALNFDITLFRIFLFSVSYSLLFMFIIMFFKQKSVKRLIFILSFFIAFLYFNQEIYNSFVEGFYSLTVVGDFTAGLSFFSDYITAFKFGHIFYFLPLIILIVLNRFKLISFDVEYCALKQPLIYLILGFLIFFFSLQTIDETIDESSEVILYTDMDLYTYMYNSQDALKKFGLLTYTQRDFFSLFRTDPLSESEYDVLITDFLATKDSIGEHEENVYSDLFKNKNLILIMAESLDTFAINEELTPNLFALKRDYAYFDNYYSPLYYRSTADTEFLVQTSMYPNKNVTLSMSAYIDNTFPNTLPKLFEEKGYSTYSFHNYIDYFYPRSDFHLNALGYDSYFGPSEMGMVVERSENDIIFNHDWQSDLDMMIAATPEFINDSRFFVNMITVSGHFKYAADHEIASKNASIVEQYQIDHEIEFNEQIFYYLAANIEFDLALGHLFEQLSINNRLDDTVVVIFGDHYAYGVDNDAIWEYDTVKDDNSDMDLHNVPLIIYSNSTEMTSHISNYMSSIDMMPTLSNLFNLDLEYNKVFGSDALENFDNFVRFADMSFVSNSYSYDSLSEEYISSNPEVYDRDYLIMLNNTIINDYKYNLLILDYDYFKKED